MIDRIALSLFLVALSAPAMAQQSLAISGANPVTLTTSGITNVTLPTSGTLLTASTAASTYAPLASPAFTGNPTITNTSGEGLAINGTGNAAGANILLEGSGATTPNKGFGASGGFFVITNNAGSADILSLSDAGDLRVTNSFGYTYPISYNTAPTIYSGFGTSPSVSASNGTAAFSITIGSSPGSTGIITMPAEGHGWVCDATDVTTQSASVFITKQTAYSSNSVTLTQYNDAAAATPWTAGDTLLVKCSGF